LQEILVVRHEIRFRVDLENCVTTARVSDNDASLGGDPARLLVGLGLPCLAQKLGRGVDIAAGLHERLLAVHHPDASALAQLLDEGR
jgi:hypothetical protein